MYLVIPKAEPSQVGEGGKRREVAYLVPRKAESSKVGEGGQRGDVAYLILKKVETRQIHAIFDTCKVGNAALPSGQHSKPYQFLFSNITYRFAKSIPYDRF